MIVQTQAKTITVSSNQLIDAEMDLLKLIRKDLQTFVFG